MELKPIKLKELLRTAKDPATQRKMGTVPKLRS